MRAECADVSTRTGPSWNFWVSVRTGAGTLFSSACDDAVIGKSIGCINNVNESFLM